MRVPLSWLKEFVDVDITAQQLQEKLFGCGRIKQDSPF